MQRLGYLAFVLIALLGAGSLLAACGGDSDAQGAAPEPDTGLDEPSAGEDSEDSAGAGENNAGATGAADDSAADAVQDGESENEATAAADDPAGAGGEIEGEGGSAGAADQGASTDQADAADTAGAEPRAYDFSAVSPVVEQFVIDNDLNGAGLIVVHRDDGVIHHEQWGEFDEDRIVLIASSSKMITAGVLLNLQDRGLLDINAPVADVVEWGAANPEITPAQLVSNSSGLVGLLPNPAYAPYLCQYLAVGTLQACAESIFTTTDDDIDVVPPDTEFRYGGAQWQIAGAVAEVVSGKSWAELIDEIYVQPCGLEVLAYNNHFAQIGTGGFDYPKQFQSDPSVLAPTDNPNMEGGAYVTTGDYGQLLLMHLRGGICGDTQVLSPEALQTMYRDRVGEDYAGDAWDPNTGYGLGWWIDRPSGRLTDGGAYGSVPWLDLEDGYGAFLLIEDDSATGNALANQLYDIVEAAIVG